MKKNNCCICKKEYTEKGHNAMPYYKGKCCNECNQKVVIPTRIRERLQEE